MLTRDDWIMIEEKRTKGVDIRGIATESGVRRKTAKGRRGSRSPILRQSWPEQAWRAAGDFLV